MRWERWSIWSQAEWKTFAILTGLLFVIVPILAGLVLAWGGRLGWFSEASGGTGVLWATGIVILLYTVETKRMRTEMARQTRSNLYERRLRIFEETRKFLSRVLADGRVVLDPLMQFWAAVAESAFLFGPEILDYLDDIYKRGLQAWRVEAEYRDLPRGDQRSALVNNESDFLGWMIEQQRDLSIRFRPYLNLSALGVSPPPGEGGKSQS